MKNFILFVVAYFVVTMGWAYSWHMIWFHDLYIAWGAFQRPEPIMALGVAAVLVQGMVIAYLYPRCERGVGSPVLRGIRFSLVIGLMVYSVMGPATAAKFEIAPVAAFLAYHTVFQAIQFILAGIALGLIYRRPSRSHRRYP